MSDTPRDPASKPKVAGPDRSPRAPGFAVPMGSWDCHAHIFGAPDLYPLSSRTLYRTEECNIEDYQHMLDTLGLSHGVIVQPSIYGIDNRCTFDAVKQSGGKWRGVAVFDEAVTETEIRTFHDAGFRGVRINVVNGGDVSGLRAAKAIADRVRPFGWHMQLFVQAKNLPELRSLLESLDIDLVIDHMGNPDPNLGTADPGFQVLLDWLRDGRCWAKVAAPYYMSKAGIAPYPDVQPLVSALVEANQDRLVWGTNWPHPWYSRPWPLVMPNDGALLDALASWIADPSVRQKILVDNPGRLYR